jgi:type VI secretion system secreted protein VgrG
MALDENSSDGAGGGPEDQPTQAGHLLQIETELGKDVLLLTALDGVETVSRGFVYTIEMLTIASDDKVRGLLGHPVTLWLRNDSATERRPLHGHIRHLTRVSVDARGNRRWQAEVVPFMWFLKHSVDCRIYQDLTIPEIIRSVFDEHELTHYELRLHEQYPKQVYRVQYRESAFDFVSRLMEHVGIFYWFEHDKDRHLLVLADSNRVAKFTEPQQVVQSLRPDLGHIQELVHDFEFRTGNWALNDFDFEVPTKNLRTREPTVLDVPPMKRFEIFDYPGSYIMPEEGKRLTRLRIQEEEAHHHKVSGTGSFAGFDAGRRFALMPDRQRNGEKPASYLLTEVRHTARDTNYFSAETAPATYSNRFVCIPVETPFRPERQTDRPTVQGPQTATVVGPAGENIHTDQYGRVRVLFHWDRRGKRDEHASCWIRVSQVSAGSRWGSLAIPHVGQEVMVDFLEGDPDRPIVTGHVHNGDNMPPLNLPRDKDKTIMRDHGDNKLIMHGKAGYQWMSMVSPRAINFVAMRSPARSLSASIAGDGSGPDFDLDIGSRGWNELQAVYKELAQQKTTPKQLQNPAFAGVHIDPSNLDQGNKNLGDFQADTVDINTLSEGDINSLSIGDTNAWVGNSMNQEVVGNTETVSHGKVTNTYHSLVTKTFDKLHEENHTLHNEFCGLHSEFTGVHDEVTLAHFEITSGLHTEIMAGIHLEINAGPHIQQSYGIDISNTITLLNENINHIVNFVNRINIGMTNVESADLHILQ